MKVLFFHAYPHQYAGAQRLTHALALDLGARGHEALVVCPDAGPFPDRLAGDGVRVEVVRAPETWRRYGHALERSGAGAALVSLPAYWARLARAIGAESPDVVHCNDHRGVLLGGPAARLAGAPVLWHLHGTYESRAITILGGLCARRIVVVSEATRAAQPALRPFRSKTEVVRNGLLTLPCETAPREASSGSGPVVVTGARIHPHKGLDVLLRAAALLRPRYPNLSVRIAGSPQAGYEAHLAQLMQLREVLGLETVVSFLGQVEDPTAAWLEATVYVQPSRVEPFGLGVLEAGALGVPVVASRTGGLAEIVVDGVTGVLVPPDEPAELARAIASVVDDPALAASLAEGGRARVAASFSRDGMVERLLGIYAELCGTGGEHPVGAAIGAAG